MKAGKLRHVITIQTATQTTDNMGGFTETWATYVTARAEIKPIKAGEIIASAKDALETTHRIIIRYQPGITGDMRVIFGSRTFQIESIINTEERNKELILLCRELV